MVAALIRLNVTLQVNQLKRSAWAAVGAVLGLLYGFGLVALGIGGLIVLGVSDLTLDARASILGLVGIVLTLGWAVVPALATGVDQTLDPSRFATMTVPQRALVTGLLIGGALTPGGIATIVAGILWGAATRTTPTSFLLGSLGGLLGAVFCLVLARLVTTALASLLRTRIFRDSAGLVLMAALMLLGPAFSGLAALVFSSPSLGPAVSGLARSPLASPWLLGADAAAGHWGALMLHLVITLVALAAALLVWSELLARELVDGGRTAASRRESRGAAAGSGMMLAFGRGAWGAVAARSLRYWLRDPRYLVAIVVVPILLGASIFLSSSPGGEFVSIFYAGLLGFLLGWNLSCDIALDSTAFWTHIATGMRGLDDRIGRTVAYSVITLPLLVLEGIVLGASRGSAITGLAIFLLALGVWGTSAGLGNWAAARFVQPTIRPHDSIFKTKTGGGVSMMVQLLGALAILLLSAPSTLLVASGLADGDGRRAVLGGAIGTLIGVAVLVVGTLVSAKDLEKSQVRLFEDLVRLDHA